MVSSMAQARKSKKSRSKSSRRHKKRETTYKTRKIKDELVPIKSTIKGVKMFEDRRGGHHYRIAVVRELTPELLEKLRKKKVHEIIEEETGRYKPKPHYMPGTRDKRLKALPPGRRYTRGKSGKWHYYDEWHWNHSDLPGSME